MEKDPFRPTDDQARALAKSLIGNAKHGALAVLLNGEPFVSRIALARGETALLTLVSDLAPHTGALRHHPRASLMIGEPGKGDPLAHPRLTLAVQAEFIEKADAADQYLADQPKAQLYIGFADFHLVRLVPTQGLLNGGFGKAYRLAPSDLGL
jgi:putative heme iron utilization protein